jgi:MFS family permease
MSDIVETAPSAPRTGLIPSILLPMGAGYFLSYFFRNANGPIGGDLMRDTGIDANRLGLLTGCYFAAFTLSQLPLGRALDVFGPRRVQAALLSVAALGALVFSMAGDGLSLAVGRFLIGLGTAGCLTAGLKATMLWFDRPDRQAADNKAGLSAVNGIFMMFGGFGAAAATVPMSWLVGTLGWRAAFRALAVAAALLAGLTLAFVPGTPKAVGKPTRRGASLAGHPANELLWTFAPMSALTFGAASAFQGLWASRWFGDVEHLPPDRIAGRLLAMAAALTIGAPLLGAIATKLRTRIDTSALAIGTAVALVIVEALICARPPVLEPLSSLILWPLLSLFGAIAVLSYGVLADFYPAELIGRANAVLNMWHTGTTFAAQYAIGMVVSWWPAVDGAYPTSAYQSAFAVMMACQVAAIALFTAKRLVVAARRAEVPESA